ncbi:MAG: PDDEXK nuclease domain-containing protein [Lachnospiraceae bacterium]|nr:PDDEXK nuclease domain-containing protein [Lachnospiraceae bacterium]
MSELLRNDEEYRCWIQELGNRYKVSQIKASIRVNNEMLMYYWSVGRDITERHANSKWGNQFFKNLSMDMADMIPNAKGFSPTNLRYMMRFYELFKDISIVPQLGEQLLENKENQIFPQVGEQFQMASNKVFMIPWGHIKLLIDKCHDNPEKVDFYVDKIIENNWSRAVLLNFLDTNLYERQGKAVTNFQYTLPKETSALAQEITKDPYNFDFVTIREGYDEKELKDALMDNVQNFLMELGTGFAFVGREYRLQVGNTEQYCDMLFYNIRRHCYVVVEVKVVEFQPGYISQTATYVSAVNHSLKGPDDTQTIGLLICKTKDNVLAKYAVETSTEPIGISEYELNALMPKDFKGTLPTIEELEQGLSVDLHESEV